MHERETIMGLVLRATKTGEADRMLLILTPNGLVSAMAKGALRIRNKLFSGTGLFCYSEFTFFERKNIYIVDEAAEQEVFWGLREDVDGMALAMYFAELITLLSPTGHEAEAQLRLLLNTLFFLSSHKLPPRLLKTIYELRAMTLAGFMPDLVACRDCMRYEGMDFYFDVQAGHLYCADCAGKRGKGVNLNAAALSAMRYIVFSNDEKLFSFTLSEKSTEMLGSVTEHWLLCCVNRPLRSLEFLRSVWGMESTLSPEYGASRIGADDAE